MARGLVTLPNDSLRESLTSQYEKRFLQALDDWRTKSLREVELRDKADTAYHQTLLGSKRKTEVGRQAEAKLAGRAELLAARQALTEARAAYNLVMFLRGLAHGEEGERL